METYTVQIGNVDYSSKVEEFTVTLQLNDKSYLDLTIDNSENLSISEGSTVSVYIQSHSSGTVVFQGLIDEVAKGEEDGTPVLKIHAQDFASLLETRNIYKEYKNTQAIDILNDILSPFPGITKNNVQNPGQSIDFTAKGKNRLDALKDLADRLQYDWYIDPSSDLHFFARGSLSSGLTITESDLESYSYKRDSSQIVNRITVLGAEYYIPANEDWTESTINWTGTGGTISLHPRETPLYPRSGKYSIMIEGYTDRVILRRTLESPMDFTKAWAPKVLTFDCGGYVPSNEPVLFNWCIVKLKTDNNNYFRKIITEQTSIRGNWANFRLNVGPESTDWEQIGSPSWSNITAIEWDVKLGSSHNLKFSVDSLRFEGARYHGLAEDSSSQQQWGIREPPYLVRDNVKSDAECQKLAEAIIAEYANVREIIENTKLATAWEDLKLGTNVTLQVPEGTWIKRVLKIVHELGDNGLTTEVTLSYGTKVVQDILEKQGQEIDQRSAEILEPSKEPPLVNTTSGVSDIGELPDIIPPAPVFTVTAEEIDEPMFFATWFKISIQKIDVAGGYTIQYKKNTETVYNEFTVSQGLESTIVVKTPFLDAASTYDIRVAALSAKGTRGDWSSTQAVTKTNDVAPPTPGVVSGYGLINGALLEWSYSFPSDFRYFEVYTNTTNNPASATLVGKTAVNSYIYSAPQGDYSTRYFWVKAVDTAGNKSGFSPNMTTGITPLQVASADIKKGIQPFNSNITFSPLSGSEHNAVTYSAGTIKFSDGTTQSISSGSFTNIPTGISYIYFTVGSSSLSITQNFDETIGDNKGLLALVQVSSDSTQQVMIFPFYSKGLNINADVIAANAIIGSKIKAGTISADRLSFTPYIIGTNTLDDIADGSTYKRVKSAALDANGMVLLDQTIDGTYGKVLATDISAGHIKLSSVVQDSNYRTVSDAEKSTWNAKEPGVHKGTSPPADTSKLWIDTSVTPNVWKRYDSSTGTWVKCTPQNLDEIADGTIYGRVLKTDISAGHIKLSECVGTLDDIDDGTTYGRVAKTDISAGHILLASTIQDANHRTVSDTEKTTWNNKEPSVWRGTTAPSDTSKLWLDTSVTPNVLKRYDSGTGQWVKCTPTNLDEIGDGTNYGRVLKTDISAGHILLSKCIGTLDDISDGTTYARVAATGISAGKIIVAGLGSDVLDRMFDSSANSDIVQAWIHPNTTYIDGGKIYTNSITAEKIRVGTLTDNIVLNPSFEQDGGWAVVEGSGSFSYTTADKTEGERSLLIGAPSVGVGCRAIPLVPGETYVIRVKVKGTSATSSGLYIRMNEKSTYPTGDYVTASNRTSWTDFVSNGPVPGSWTTYEKVYTVPSGIYWGSFSIYNWSGGPSGGIYVDEVEVRKQLRGVHIEDNAITTDQLQLSRLDTSTGEPTKEGALYYWGPTDELRFIGTSGKKGFIPRYPIKEDSAPLETLVPNHSFEEDVDGNNIPDFWSDISWGSYSISRISSDSATGKYCMQLTANAASSEGANAAVIASAFIPVEPGKRYYVSAKAKGVSGGKCLDLHIWVYDRNKQNPAYVTVLATSPIPDTWTTFSGPVQIPSGYYWARVALKTWNKPNQSSMIYVDDVVFSDIRAATPTSLGVVNLSESSWTNHTVESGVQYWRWVNISAVPYDRIIHAWVGIGLQSTEPDNKAYMIVGVSATDETEAVDLQLNYMPVYEWVARGFAVFWIPVTFLLPANHAGRVRLSEDNYDAYAVALSDRIFIRATSLEHFHR